jgi:hypothetical protein
MPIGRLFDWSQSPSFSIGSSERLEEDDAERDDWAMRKTSDEGQRRARPTAGHPVKTGVRGTDGVSL